MPSLVQLDELPRQMRIRYAHNALKKVSHFTKSKRLSNCLELAESYLNGSPNMDTIAIAYDNLLHAITNESECTKYVRYAALHMPCAILIDDNIYVEGAVRHSALAVQERLGTSEGIIFITI